MCDRQMMSIMLPSGGNPYFWWENGLTTSQTMFPQGLKRMRVINNGSSLVSGMERLHLM